VQGLALHSTDQAVKKANLARLRDFRELCHSIHCNNQEKYQLCFSMQDPLQTTQITGKERGRGLAVLHRKLARAGEAEDWVVVEEDLVLQFITALSFSSSLLIMCIWVFLGVLGVLGVLVGAEEQSWWQGRWFW
jgi:hypothetical protein